MIKYECKIPRIDVNDKRIVVLVLILFQKLYIKNFILFTLPDSIPLKA